MLVVGFEPVNPARERPQTHVLERADTRVDPNIINRVIK
jgi:hypothetical protein